MYLALVEISRQFNARSCIPLIWATTILHNQGRLLFFNMFLEALLFHARTRNANVRQHKSYGRRDELEKCGATEDQDEDCRTGHKYSKNATIYKI